MSGFSSAAAQSPGALEVPVDVRAIRCIDNSARLEKWDGCPGWETRVYLSS